MSVPAVLLGALALAPVNDIPHVPAGPPLTGGPSELFAAYMAAAGDVDGDGFSDLIVASVDDAGPMGIARVYSGADQRVLIEFVYPGASSFLDRPVNAAGDVNGDGLGDVLVGSPTEDKVYVLAGPDGELLETLTGPVPGDGFGGSVASAGDVDGDGLDDVIIGATGLGSPGYALVHSGADGSLLQVLHGAVGERFGHAVDGLGDVSGDGVPDLLVSAPSGGREVRNPGFPPFVPPFLDVDGSGRIRVLSGADGSTLWSAVGEQPFDGLGWSVAAAGDVDGDGVTDVVAGSTSLDDPPQIGYAVVYSGADGHPLFTLDQDSQSPGQMMEATGVGDVDADGHDDVAVAKRAAGPDQVAVRIFSGRTGRPLFGWNPAAPSLSGRITVAGPGDLDGDGQDDFAIAESQIFIGGGLVQVFISR